MTFKSGIYVISGEANVYVIDTTTNTVIGIIPVGVLTGIAYDPVNHRMYAVNGEFSGEVLVIDTDNNTVIDTRSNNHRNNSNSCR